MRWAHVCIQRPEAGVQNYTWCSSTLFIEEGLSSNPELTDKTSLISQHALGISSQWLKAGLQVDHLAQPAFMWSVGYECQSSHCACMTSTLITEPCTLSLYHIYKMECFFCLKKSEWSSQDIKTATSSTLAALYMEFQVSQDYMSRPCPLRTKRQRKKFEWLSK